MLKDHEIEERLNEDGIEETLKKDEMKVDEIEGQVRNYNLVCWNKFLNTSKLMKPFFTYSQK